MNPRFEPAFPVNDTVIDGRSFEPEYMGITMRDYFAAKALQGMLGNTDITGDRKEDIVNEAYEFADEMLRARGAP